MGPSVPQFAHTFLRFDYAWEPGAGDLALAMNHSGV